MDALAEIGCLIKFEFYKVKDSASHLLLYVVKSYERIHMLIAVLTDIYIYIDSCGTPVKQSKRCERKHTHTLL